MEEQEAIAITTGHIYQFREMVLLFYTLLNFLFYPSPPLIQQAPSHPTSSFSVNILSQHNTSPTLHVSLGLRDFPINFSFPQVQKKSKC